jgi:ABC-type phosphate transport system substrate-binding protein
MARPRITWLVLALVMLFAAPARRASSAGDAFKIIVHPDNPATSIDRDLLRRVYLKKASGWRPIDLSSSVGARARFTRDVLKKTPSQLRSYWSQQVFSGKGGPPPEARSVAAAISYVLAHPGAVAYIPADVDAGGAKVVELR